MGGTSRICQASTMSEPVVSVRELTHRFGDVVALRDLQLDVAPGVTGLVGANGAGKTTLLRILLGLVHPTAGATTVMGHNAEQDPIAVRSAVGYMPEGACIPRDQTAADFVAFAAELAGVPPKDDLSRDANGNRSRGSAGSGNSQGC